MAILNNITPSSGAGSGDVLGPPGAVDGEVVVFSGTTGKAIKRTSFSGLLKATAGVLTTAVAGVDYVAAAHTHAAADINSGVLETARLPPVLPHVPLRRDPKVAAPRPRAEHAIGVRAAVNPLSIRRTADAGHLPGFAEPRQ